MGEASSQSYLTHIMGTAERASSSRGKGEVFPGAMSAAWKGRVSVVLAEAQALVQVRGFRGRRRVELRLQQRDQGAIVAQLSHLHCTKRPEPANRNGLRDRGTVRCKCAECCGKLDSVLRPEDPYP